LRYHRHQAERLVANIRETLEALRIHIFSVTQEKHLVLTQKPLFREIRGIAMAVLVLAVIVRPDPSITAR
jgi:hypothetical protein